jgi:hypothetical protein
VSFKTPAKGIFQKLAVSCRGLLCILILGCLAAVPAANCWFHQADVARLIKRCCSGEHIVSIERNVLRYSIIWTKDATGSEHRYELDSNIFWEYRLWGEDSSDWIYPSSHDYREEEHSLFTRPENP